MIEQLAAALVMLWLVMTVAGGALGTFVAIHYAIDVRKLPEDATYLKCELAWSRLRLIVALCLGWAVFVMMGLLSVGIQVNFVLWNGTAFATMFYWFYCMFKSVKMRLALEDGAGDDPDYLTGV